MALPVPKDHGSLREENRVRNFKAEGMVYAKSDGLESPHRVQAWDVAKIHVQ